MPPPLHAREKPDIISRAFERFPEVDREGIMEFIRDHFPREMRQFRELSAKRFSEAAELMSDVIRESLELLETRERNPEVYAKRVRQRELEIRTAALVEAIREAEDRDREKRLEELRGILEEAFEIKQELMKIDVAHMEKEISELKKMVARREANRKAIINRRVSEITGEMDYLEW